MPTFTKAAPSGRLSILGHHRYCLIQLFGTHGTDIQMMQINHGRRQPSITWSSGPAPQGPSSPLACRKTPASRSARWSPVRPTGTRTFTFRRASSRCMFNEAFTWQFKTEPSPRRQRPLGHHPGGRTVGGSSSINGMIYQPRPARRLQQLGAARQSRAGATSTCCPISSASSGGSAIGDDLYPRPRRQHAGHRHRLDRTRSARRSSPAPSAWAFRATPTTTAATAARRRLFPARDPPRLAPQRCARVPAAGEGDRADGASHPCPRLQVCSRARRRVGVRYVDERRPRRAPRGARRARR